MFKNKLYLQLAPIPSETHHMNLGLIADTFVVLVSFLLAAGEFRQTLRPIFSDNNVLLFGFAFVVLALIVFCIQSVYV